MADRRNAVVVAVPRAKRHLEWTLSALQLDKHWRRTRCEGNREEGGGASSSSALILLWSCWKTYMSYTSVATVGGSNCGRCFQLSQLETPGCS